MLLSVRLGIIFPLDALSWLHKALVSKLQAACSTKQDRWHGLRRLAIDKTTVALPESKSLWKSYGCHKGKKGLGPVAVELCCLFDLVSRAPLRYVYDKSATSEHKLVKKLTDNIKKHDLLLLDSGFYYCATFFRIIARKAHFLIPAKKNFRPRVLQKLGLGDYLCTISDSYNENTIQVRVIFVYRKGFRRRRLVTSLWDPSLYSAEELAQLYHMRWDIETFYRDFKNTMRATSWHCQTPATFQKEILVHMISICLIRMAMLAAGRMKNAPVSSFSFARALTETRRFLSSIVSSAKLLPWMLVYGCFIHACARHRVSFKYGRVFSRNKQEYRKKSRGLERKRPGRKPKFKSIKPSAPLPEVFNDLKGRCFLLS